MILLTPGLTVRLAENYAASFLEIEGSGPHDPAPVVKFFNPCGAATWLATEMYEGGDTLFGLADLGFGCPELGTFSLSDIEGVRLPFGLRIERDLTFATTTPLSVWAELARRHGSIMDAEVAIARRENELPRRGG